MLRQAGLLVDVVSEHVSHGVVTVRGDVTLLRKSRTVSDRLGEKVEREESWTNVVRVTLREAGKVVGSDVGVRDHVREKEVANALLK